MSLHFKTIRWKNLLSTGNNFTEINLSQTGTTLLHGENGSGKSTLLEGIAAATHLPTVGAGQIDHDNTLAAARLLAASLRLRWTLRTHLGFFLRAEDFFGFTKALTQQRAVDLMQMQQMRHQFAGVAVDDVRGLHAVLQEGGATFGAGAEFPATRTPVAGRDARRAADLAACGMACADRP